jgi:hypothetical protein
MTSMQCRARTEQKTGVLEFSIFVRPSEPLPPHPDSNKTFGALPIVLEGYDPTVFTRYIFDPNSVCLTLIKGKPGNRAITCASSMESCGRTTAMETLVRPEPLTLRMSSYEGLRSTMQAPPARRMLAHRSLALSSVSVPTRIW